MKLTTDRQGDYWRSQPTSSSEDEMPHSVRPSSDALVGEVWTKQTQIATGHGL